MRTKIQVIKFTNQDIICANCKTKFQLVDCIYRQIRHNKLKYWLELHTCPSCDNEFYIRHEIFNENGHINPLIYVEDINDLSYTWTNILTKKQKKVVAEHIQNCRHCQNNRDSELCTTAQLNSYITYLRGTP